MADEKDTDEVPASSVIRWLKGLVPKSVGDSSVGRFVGSAVDNSTVGAKANLAHDYWNSVTSPAKEPGGNIINDLATELWHSGVKEFNKADKFAVAAQHSKSFGDWASNTSQSFGHLGASALPGVGPAAATAGEEIGTGKNLPEGLGAATGLVASALVGSEALGKLSKGAAPAEDADKGIHLVDNEPETPKTSKLGDRLYKVAADAQDKMDERAMVNLREKRGPAVGAFDTSDGDDTKPINKPGTGSPGKVIEFPSEKPEPWEEEPHSDQLPADEESPKYVPPKGLDKLSKDPKIEDEFHRVVGRNVNADTPELEKLFDHAEPHTTTKPSILGIGNEHTVVDLGDKVAKIGYGEPPVHPDVPELLKPDSVTHVSGPASEMRGGIHQEIYPKADTSDISYKDIGEMTDKLADRGWTWDPAIGNLGRIDGKLKILDSGGLQPIAAGASAGQ